MPAHRCVSIVATARRVVTLSVRARMVLARQRSSRGCVCCCGNTLRGSAANTAASQTSLRTLCLTYSAVLRRHLASAALTTVMPTVGGRAWVGGWGCYSLACHCGPHAHRYVLSLRSLTVAERTAFHVRSLLEPCGRTVADDTAHTLKVPIDKSQ